MGESEAKSGDEMRIAAGIMLMILGVALLSLEVFLLVDIGIGAYGPSFDIFMIVFSAFSVTGGVLCLKRRYWGVCFASALFSALFMIFYLANWADGLIWLTCFFTIQGTLPIIFVCLRRRDWQKSQAS